MMKTYPRPNLLAELGRYFGEAIVQLCSLETDNYPLVGVQPYSGTPAPHGQDYWRD